VHGSFQHVALFLDRQQEGPNVNFAIFQLGRLLMENSRKYTSLSGLTATT
jgi:hypothetical protein